MSEKIRSFISVDVEDRQLVERLVELQQTLRQTGADLKLVEPENLHFTLRFLGELSPSTLKAVVEELGKLRFQPFPVRLQGLGAFPSVRRINVVWVGMSEGAEKLGEIAKNLEAGLRRIGIPPDPKGFSPHLTLARVKTGKNREELSRLLAQHSQTPVGRMEVKAVRLKRSILTPKGPRYSTVHEVSGFG
ncbi:RNA 2',3'-cyclic phosphodiesterase [Candidatus Hecatella orcuttiae]|uniref:RNA 2',3'-cyclic phosphodiesterase n=1 Tax=Candidatus Hecatella orcuttiae TaxID=1935119 RepID=UPI0028681973|nr:RNA 2',3'-cyclic phosphodiesterase [Candidatus Hecatella orcuttiae]